LVERSRARVLNAVNFFDFSSEDRSLYLRLSSFFKKFFKGSPAKKTEHALASEASSPGGDSKRRALGDDDALEVPLLELLSTDMGAALDPSRLCMHEVTCAATATTLSPHKDALQHVQSPGQKEASCPIHMSTSCTGGGSA
jgi:hypothetical protein